MGEYLRKLWHAMFGVIIGSMVYFWTPKTAQAAMISLIFGLLLLKMAVLRRYNIPVIKDYLKVLTSERRVFEVGEGSMFFIFGSLIASLFFPKEVAAVSIIVLGVSDAAATMVGINSKRYIFGKKTIDGSLAFFISSLIILTIAYNFAIGLLISLVLTPIELVGGFDDNIVIPPACSLLIVLLQKIII